MKETAAPISPRVCVIDSGVHLAPLSRRAVPLESRSFVPDSDDAFFDESGHGTRCTQLLLHQCPIAAIRSVKIFGRTLSAPSTRLLEALRFALPFRDDVICVSLCTTDRTIAAELGVLCSRARLQGTVVVAAWTPRHPYAIPAALAEVCSVGVESIPAFDAQAQVVPRPDVELRVPDLGVEWTARWGRAAHDQPSYAAATFAGIVAANMDLVRRDATIDNDQIAALVAACGGQGNAVLARKDFGP